MAEYEVLRTFVTYRGRTLYSGVKGDVKPLEDEVAGWIERDSPGRLRLVADPEPDPKPELRRKKRAARAASSDRMVRGSEDR